MRESLKTPPKLARDTLRVIPLGGLGDVGRNSTSFEINGQLLLIDCGVIVPRSARSLERRWRPADDARPRALIPRSSRARA